MDLWPSTYLCRQWGDVPPRKRPDNEGPDDHEHAPDRVAAGVEGRARGTARRGEGADPRPRRAGREAPPHAEDGRRERLCVRGPERPRDAARPLRGAPAADRLPLLLRAGSTAGPTAAAPGAPGLPIRSRTPPI